MSGTQCFLPLNLALTTEPPPLSSFSLNEPPFQSTSLVCSPSYPRSPSHCVNRIITTHFLEGQISCSHRACMELPFPIDNHVCSSAGFTAQSSVNTTIRASNPPMPALAQPWHTWGPGCTVVVELRRWKASRRCGPSKRLCNVQKCYWRSEALRLPVFSEVHMTDVSFYACAEGKMMWRLLHSQIYMRG
jgi:hypothetical protein